MRPKNLTEAKQRGRELCERAEAMQQAVCRLWLLAGEYCDAGRRFTESLPGAELSSLDPAAVTASHMIARRIALALWVTSSGAFVPHRPPLLNWVEAREAGYSDFAKHADEYVRSALRDCASPPRPPEAA